MTAFETSRITLSNDSDFLIADDKLLKGKSRGIGFEFGITGNSK